MASDVVEELAGLSVVYRDKADFNAKLDVFKAGGRSRMSVISDFDFTITKFWIPQESGDGDGNEAKMRSASCHKVLEDAKGILSEDYCERAQGLQKKYYPLEISTELSLEEKIVFMVEWVEQANALLVESRLTKVQLYAAVEMAMMEKRINLRTGTREMLDLLSTHGVPLLIFSAGISDILERVLILHLQRGDSLLPNEHVVSNRCIFSEETGALEAFSHPALHVFNKKSKTFLDVCPFFQSAELRKNVFVFGDSLGDANMAIGLPEDTLCIKIGFLNDKVEERLSEFLSDSHFDLVVLGDPGLDVQNHLINLVVGSSGDV